MERKIEKQLLKWRNAKNRLPLIVHGARQVGKTYSILWFGKQNYQKVHYFNFESNERLKAIFDKDLSPERIVSELSIFSGSKIVENTDLVFFDEIQSCEKALTSLKYFSEQKPDIHLIAAGSLLGVAINRQNHSFPVGKIAFETMYPMDFEEFLWATLQRDAANLIRNCYEKNSECSLHATFMDYYKQYLIVGGMPQIVKEFMETKSFENIYLLQRNIFDSYIADMAKYANGQETVRIISCYNSIPAQLAKENKKFQYKIIKSGARSNVYETAVDWLKSSGILHCFNKVKSGHFPLHAFTEHSSFKLYMADTGLLCAKYNIPANMLLSDSDMVNNIKGVLTENYVACTLISNGYNANYWESEGKAEVDFVIQNQAGDIIPIEVKSSENVRSKSLLQYISLYKPQYSIRISTKNFGYENHIKSVPVYATFCI